MRSCNSREVVVGDTVVWRRRAYHVVEVSIDSRSGRVSLQCGRSGTIYFNASEAVEVLEESDDFFCASCRSDTNLIDGGCAKCGANKLGDPDKEIGDQSGSTSSSEKSLAANPMMNSGNSARDVSIESLSLYPPSGKWDLDPNNAAQMARIFVEAEELVSSHPTRGIGCIAHHDLAAAEHWFNEVADAASAAMLVPAVFRDEAVAKRFKKLRNPVSGDYWGIGYGFGNADETLEVVYGDAAQMHAELVLDNPEHFPVDGSLEERVARHYRDCLCDQLNRNPAEDEEFIRKFREIRFAVGDPLSAATMTHLKYARMTPEQMKTLLSVHYHDTARRLWVLATRQGRQAILDEIAIPGAGEYACTSPDPSPRPPIGWFPDPAGRHEFRYFNGLEWTQDVSDRGGRNRDAFDVSSLNRTSS